MPYSMVIKHHFPMQKVEKIENFNKEQWEETCIIFQKLIRNLKEEVPEVTVENYCQTLPVTATRPSHPELYGK